MAVDETGYTRRTTPSAGAAMPRRTAEDYGAAVFDQVQRSAERMDQQALRGYQIERQLLGDQQTSDFTHRFALQRQRMDDVILQARTNPSSPDYADHVGQVMEAFDASREDLLAGITEGSVRRRAEQQIDSYATSLHDSESQYAFGQQVAKTIGDQRETVRIGANRILTSGDPQSFKQELTAAYQNIEGLTGLTPVQKDAMVREVDQEYGVAYANHLNNTNPAMALAQLDAGVFNEMLTPQQIDQLRSGAQVEIRRVQAQEAQAASVERAAFREQVSTVKAKAAQGIDVSDELPQLAAQAAAYGDTSTVVDLQGIHRENGFAKAYSQLPPLARDRRIAELQAIPQGKRSEDQQAELKWQLDKKGSLDAQFNSDPVGFAAEHAPPAQQPPQITDWSSQEISAREQWVKQSVGAYGRMEPLSATEAKALQEQAELGDGQYRKVLATVSQFSPRLAMQAMRQVLPQDRFAQSLVALPSDIQRRALDGRVVQKANSAILNSPKDDLDAAAQLGGVRAGFLMAMSAAPADQSYGILDVANSIAAESLGRRGFLSDKMNGSVMAWALDRALGAQGDGAEKKGGLGFWGGKIYVLPSGVTQRGFEQHVTGYLRFHPENLPVNPDGSTVDLRKAKPQALGSNRYQFMIGDRVVVGKDGKPWIRTVNPK